MDEQFYKELRCILRDDQIKLKERLEYHTSLHIGGEADYFVTPESIDQIKDVIHTCKRFSVPYYIIGNGSNLLVSDQGFRGLIVKLGDYFADVTVNEDGTVTAQAGILLSKLALEISRHGLTGFEFASGIPGTLGGAVTMNAGAYGGEMKQCLTGARVLDQDGRLYELSLEELQLDYRSSILQKENLILLEADLSFTKGDREQILHQMSELNKQRREKQPLDQYSAGSTFKRPQGHYAAKLIEDAGLRGYQVGEAAVSEKHCGFIVNKGKATAKEFLTVIQDVTRIVHEKFGVLLEPEVRMLGDF